MTAPRTGVKIVAAVLSTALFLLFGGTSAFAITEVTTQVESAGGYCGNSSTAVDTEADTEFDLGDLLGVGYEYLPPKDGDSSLGIPVALAGDSGDRNERECEFEFDVESGDTGDGGDGGEGGDTGDVRSGDATAGDGGTAIAGDGGGNGGAGGGGGSAGGSGPYAGAVLGNNSTGGGGSGGPGGPGSCAAGANCFGGNSTAGPGGDAETGDPESGDAGDGGDGERSGNSGDACDSCGNASGGRNDATDDQGGFFPGP